MTHPWRLSELVELANRVLVEDAEPDGSRRVRWQPNERLVRYYSTLGLLDRPLEMRGRTAYYGPRHLLQLLSVKCLQRSGLGLAEIQSRLQGLPDTALRRICSLPEDWLPPEASAVDSTSEPGPTGPDGGVREASALPFAPGPFWERLPRRLPTGNTEPQSLPARPLAPEEAPLLGIELAPGVTLLLDRQLTAGLDLGRLRRLAGPLVDSLYHPSAPETPEKEDEP